MEEIRKDANPKDTIKRIKKILKSLSIQTTEKKIKNIHKKFYSVRLEIKGFYHMGTNGKGLTKNLARASAYAELMERLSSRILINTYYLGKEKNLYSFTDETEKKTSQLPLTSFLEKDFSLDSKKYQITSTFHNVFQNKEEYLPIKLINATSFSNGLCAGNSYQEATSQGICEVLERFCYRTILEEEKPLSTITLDETISINKRIQYLESLGYTIKVKDCSLGKYPVIGVLILDHTKENYIFTVGSDANINIAIQRCLTEAFQGLKNEKQLNQKMKPIKNNFSNLTESEKKTNWLKCYASNNGIHPQILWQEKKTLSYKTIKVFQEKKDNTSNYEYLLSILKKNHLDLYIKDYSYLDFPVYKVFIPLLSNVDCPQKEESSLLNHQEKIRDIYFDLTKEYSKKEIQEAINSIKPVLSNEKYKFMNMGNYFHSSYFLKTNYNTISFELFYLLLNYKIHTSIKDLSWISNPVLKEYIQKIDSQRIDNKFSYIIKDLNLKTPTCPNCEDCPCRRNCKYKNWKKINESLKKKETN